jgi:hypothetical protein
MHHAEGRLKYSPFILLVLLGVIYISGCNVNSRFAEAESASRVFHQRMSDGAYNAIYDDSTDKTKNRLKREEFLSFMTLMRQDAGECSSAQLQAKSAFVTPGGAIIQLTYKRQCEKRILIEQLNWYVTDGKCLLDEFHATPLALN